MMLIDVNHETRLKKEGYGQYNTTTCWLACYRMIYKWAGKDESTIPGKLTKAGLNYSDLCKRSIYINEWPVAGSSLGMCGWEGRRVKAWDDEQLVYVLKGYGPLFLTWDYGTSGHALLLVGFDAQMGYFKIYDPYNPFQVGTIDVDWATPSQLRGKIHKDRWALQAMY